MIKESLEKIVCNKLIHIVVDVLECLMIDIEQMYEKDGKIIKFNARKEFDSTLFHARRFLKSVRSNSMESQEMFGEDADEIKKLVILYIDRVGGDKERTKLFMQYLQNTSPVANLDLKQFHIDL